MNLISQEGRKYVEKKAEGSRKKSIDEHEEDDKAEVKKHMEVVQDDEEIAIFRSRYSSMIRMLQNISREDLETLWKLVKTKHGNTRPEDVYEKVIAGTKVNDAGLQLLEELLLPEG
ncbi:hypothetical protein Tco_0682500 [Tanacetum coccineum]|uniref:Uncharacterized protein n=1 Tax=Tanacetum coccineum TaxID=301880 RepID=A0ABQ4XRB3_9ASTR